MKIMSIINIVRAFIILFFLSTTVVNLVKTHVYNEEITCECQPIISKIQKNYIVCFRGCPIVPINSRLYNTSCSYMEEITITLCQNDRYISTIPNIEIHESYIWTSYLLKIWKIVATIIVWLILILTKMPSLCAFSVINSVFNKLMEKKLKRCEACESKYSLAHVDCPTPGFKHRTDYNFIFYVILMILVLVTFAKADDNEYNYYQHNNVTEVQILDKEHFQQNIDVNGYLYVVTVQNSHLELETVNISEVYIPTQHMVLDSDYSCHGAVECFKNIGITKNTDVQWSIKKIHDGLSCLISSATVCGTCKSELKFLGTKVTTAKVKPYIDLKIQHGNKTQMIKIRDFSEFSHEPYYVKPIKPVLIESINLFVTGHKVYKGQMCSMPAYGCFGPNYKKDKKIFLLKSPVIRDTLSHDREVILESCIDPGNSDINSLEETDYVYQNGTMIKPFEFGMISIGIPMLGKLVGDFCKRPADIEDLNVIGCYDCQSGIELTIKYKATDRCAEIRCTIGRVVYKYYVDSESDSMSLHSFYDQESVDVTCSGFTKNFQLAESKDSDYYKTNSEVHGSTALEFNLFKHLPNLITNPKTVATALFMLMLFSYMSISILLKLYKLYHKIKEDSKTRRYKKTDNPDEVEGLTVNFTNVAIVPGEAQ
ncbi:glycoprotein precursor [blackberry leaf mottle-associated virus]|uniref:Glycoprotein n=1 Tax=blackberry leaf mottle-associated virus TaxID=3070201 RepID=A0A1W5RTW0_9VIRU|nr:glycoprotein precursor [blackberry leaf mottle-associated virus]AQX45474.1 glycoprotein precursor [blackberry leaf mottle-associated virus]